MNQKTSECYDQKQLNQFLENQLDEKVESNITDHIAECEQCQKSLERMAGQQDDWNEIKTHFHQNKQELAGAETRDEHDLNCDRKRDVQQVQKLLGPTDDPEKLGRLGSYEVCGVIGRGSAGIVVKAFDARLNRYVAIKMLAPVYSNNGSSRRRFEREGRAIASVKDPHVIPIHSVDDFQGTPYIVMQYMPDGSLLQRIEKHGPLSNREIVCVAMQVAKGLSAAHRAGIVHRDVKPANVLLERGVDGAMVTDFGLARVVDEATMTRSGSISGTPQFMSPEQARGESVDPRSDLFSLGSVMFAASTGHAPFRAETVFGVIKRVCETEPRSIRESNPDIAEWLTAFVAKLHAKNRDDRFDSADQVAELLSRELAHMQSPTMVSEPSREWWQKKEAVLVTPKANKNSLASAYDGFAGWKWITAASLLLAAIGWFAFAFSGSGNDSPVDQKQADRGTASMPFVGDVVLEPNSFAVTGVESGSSSVNDRVFTSITSNNRGDLPALLATLKQENKELTRFENTVETTIDVSSGGLLLMHTNLGRVDVTTHNKSSVIMRLVHEVKTDDEETASKLFKALKINYDLEAEEARDFDLKTKRDAVIIAKFPIRKMTQEEIAAAVDLEELKEQLLIRNNNHYSNARFELIVPEKFNLNLATFAGSITSDDVDGTVTFLTHGGKIQTKNISGITKIESHGGRISIGDVQASANIKTHGGKIETGSIDGDFGGVSHGGRISTGTISGSANVESHGGKIELSGADGTVKALSHGGSVTVWKAGDAVEAESHGGSIRVNFVGQPKAESILLSHAGSVKVGLLDKLAFKIDAKTNNGRVSAPFLEKSKKEIVYQLNDGTVVLKLRTDVGPIKIESINMDEIDAYLKKQTEDRKSQQYQMEGQQAFNHAYDLHMEGKIDEALEAHKHAATYEEFQGIATYNIGCAWALKGEKEKAIAALIEAYENGFDDRKQFETDSDLDSLRKDERFIELMSRMGGSEGSSRESEDMKNDLVSDDLFGVRREAIELFTKGHNLFEMEKAAEAEEVFRQALELDPSFDKAVVHLGLAIHTQGRLDEAVKWHERAANSAHQQFAQIGQYNLACVHSLKDENDEAVIFLTKAINAGFSDIESLKNDDDLSNLRKDKRFKELLKLAKKNSKCETCDSCESDKDCDDEKCESDCERKAREKDSRKKETTSASDEIIDQ